MLFILAMACSSGSPTCPPGMVRIDGGSYTVGVSEPQEAWHEPARKVQLDDYCIDVYEYPNTEGELPKSDVSWEEAKSLCEKGGKRLCTSEEWERACRGEARQMYSYGDSRDAEACNTPIEGGAPGGHTPLAVAGSHPRCTSAEGVRDLNGNVSEWVIGDWDGPGSEGTEAAPESWRLLRGGTMWSKTSYGQDCASRHAHDGSSYRNIDDGFRCCKGS
jgi:formylglycine-generating enzyme required for sulfatase activity